MRALFAAPIVVSVFALAACQGAGRPSTPVDVADPRASVDRFEAHVKFLADDRLEGREAGSRGHEIAALYVAEQLRAAGVRPAGDNETYFQTVPLRAYSQGAENGGVLSVAAGGEEIALDGGVHYLVAPSAREEVARAQGPLVFVGYGVHAPESGHDDFEGLDLEGKIAVRAYGAPAGLNTEERAHHRTTGTASAAASARGAIGLITIWSPEVSRRFGFERLVARSGASSSMTSIGPDGTPHSRSPNLKTGAIINLEGAERLFDAAAPVAWADILAVLESGEGELPRFAFDAAATIAARAVHEDIESPNVVGVLPGTDRRLRDQYVVVSAHLDHIGIGGADGDDAINNGAMDNAVGTSAMLETARILAAKGGLKRSVLFVAVTAEEKGLVGADYFARNPTVARDGLVANVNLDMPIINYDFTDVTAFGAERSNLFPAVEAAARAARITLSPDPAPEEGLFTRSDQYAFVRQGVPAVYLKTGFDNGGGKAQRDFRATRYHRPSDEADDTIVYSAGAKFVNLNAEIITRIADMPERPAWNEGDFFGELYGVTRP